MQKEQPVNFEIGFADSCIQSYCIEGNNLILLLECWNAKILEIKFLDFASLFAMNYIEVADLVEVFESPLLERVLNTLYEKKPEIHNYRIFKFIDSDDMTALEVVCKDIKIVLKK